ncbi:MAG: cytochrome c1 [Hyphomicrobiaceae bacterium]
MTKTFGMKVLAGLALALAIGAAPAPVTAAGDTPIIKRHDKWTYGGLRGHFDNVQLQRGFQVYQEVCAACHGLKRVYFRNLAEPGGPGFPEEAVKALAASWPNQIFAGPNDAGDIADRRGRILKRPALLSDPILGPYDNDKAAAAANNGAVPPDLSLITKARTGAAEYHGSLIGHPVQMLSDIVRGYQEGGSDYVYALLNGYDNTPANMKMADGMHYNKAFPGYQIAMAKPLQDGQVKYQDPATPRTVAQYAEDVTAFLAWAGDPKLEERKSMGLKVLLYLLITTLLLYLAKKRLWSRLH